MLKAHCVTAPQTCPQTYKHTNGEAQHTCENRFASNKRGRGTYLRNDSQVIIIRNRDQERQ